MKTKPAVSKRYRNISFQKALGEHCREIRIKKGYSIDRMYREGDQLSPGAIQRLERGEGDCHISLLYRYARVLNIPPYELLKFQIPKKS